MSKKREPTKDERFFGKVGLITSLNRTGEITDREAMQRIGWLVDEYLQPETPVQVIRRAFGIKTVEQRT